MSEIHIQCRRSVLLQLIDHPVIIPIYFLTFGGLLDLFISVQEIVEKLFEVSNNFLFDINLMSWLQIRLHYKVIRKILFFLFGQISF
jgi:hypothetical protein